MKDNNKTDKKGARRGNKRDSMHLTSGTATSSSTAAGNNDGAVGPKTPSSSSDHHVSGSSSTKKRMSMATAANTSPTPNTPAMDVHPYPRGSVIEVLYIPATAVGKTTASIQAALMNGDQWYWSDDSSLCTTTSNSSQEDDSQQSKSNKKSKKEENIPKKEEIPPKKEEIPVKKGRGRPAKKKKGPPPKKDKDKDKAAATEKADKDKEKSSKASASQKTKDQQQSQNQHPHHYHHHHHNHQNAASVRLCDIIDRVPTNTDGAWRYYVHYRDFNRRMDEWIGKDRIVSPPSIGNAKARALKKEEEKLKRKQQRLEEKQKEQQQQSQLDPGAPRSSRRRSTIVASQQHGATPNTGGTAAAGTTGGTDAATHSAGVDPTADNKGRRTTRLRRRSTHANAHVDDDAATVVAGNNDDSNHPGASSANPSLDNKQPAAVKEILTLPTGNSAMATTTVGEHIVATIPAQELDEHEGLDEASLREHEEITKIKNVSFIELGRHQMETWYFSPIPKELLSARGYIEVLYICEFTFRLFARKCELQRFQQRTLHSNNQQRHPPGNEIYRKDNLSMFEVDGLTERIYCQNLSYIAKLFLDHKTLYFDVDPFLFYVLCEVDDRGYHPVGYYSKEKYSDVGYNLACILTFPAHQRKGYGRFLIAFSYELSKKQEKVGGPERPVSDLGQKAYKPYWAATVIDFLRTTGKEAVANTDHYGTHNNSMISSSSLSIMDISKRTSIMAEDIVFTLNQLGILKIINGVYFIAAEESLLERLAQKYPVKEPRIDPTKLHWTPFLTDVKRDKFSIHSKKPNLDDGFASVVVQQQQPGAATAATTITAAAATGVSQG